MEAERTEFHTIIVGLSHNDTARNYRTLIHFPSLLNDRTEEASEYLLILCRANHKAEVAKFDDILRSRDHDSSIRFFDTRDNIVARDESVKFLHVKTIDKIIGHLASHHVRREGRSFFIIVEFGTLLGNINIEDFLQENHSENDAHHAERISGSISHRHLLAHILRSFIHLEHSLLSRTESGGIGDSTTHHTHKLRDGGSSLGSSLDEIDSKHNAHIHQDTGHGKSIHLYASLLERGEETGADLHTD